MSVQNSSDFCLKMSNLLFEICAINECKVKAKIQDTMPKSRNSKICHCVGRFIIETDDLSRRIIRMIDHPSDIDHPSWYEYKTNYPDELCKSPIETCTCFWITAFFQIIWKTLLNTSISKV